MLRALSCAAVCGLSLSSCVVDPYGMPMAGAVYPATNVGYYDNGYSDVGYYNNGYGYAAPLFTPVSTSFSFFSGSGWGNNCNRPVTCHPPVVYSRPACNTSIRSVNSFQGFGSRSQPCAPTTVRSSGFRGNSGFSRPPMASGISTPHGHSRPSFGAPRTAPTLRTAPSMPTRSFGPPRPSGHFERSSSPIIQASSRSFFSPVASSSGNLAGTRSSARHHSYR